MCPRTKTFFISIIPHTSLDAYLHIFTYNDANGTTPVCTQTIPVPHDPKQKRKVVHVPLPGTNSGLEWSPLTYINLNLSKTLTPGWAESPSNVVTVSWWSSMGTCSPSKYAGIQSVFPGKNFTTNVGTFPGWQGEGIAIFGWEQITPASSSLSLGEPPGPCFQSASPAPYPHCPITYSETPFLYLTNTNCSPSTTHHFTTPHFDVMNGQTYTASCTYSTPGPAVPPDPMYFNCVHPSINPTTGTPQWTNTKPT